MNQLIIKRSENILLFLAGAWILFGACAEFYNIGWGTGIWLGQFSLKWALAFFLFGLFCILCLIGIWSVLWKPQNLERTFNRLSSLRAGLGRIHRTFAIIPAIIPTYILQYTFWGIVLHEPYLRILLAVFSAILLGWLLTKEGDGLLSWPAALTALVLISGVCAFFVPLARVTGYPFSLGWSEGNRLWDYSILFGSHLYDYPAGKPIPVFLDIGRQFLGGIPFLIPGITIQQARLWVALMDVVPYLVLGWAAYRLTGNNILRWTLAGIWAFTFVSQGPIHPPLLICAIVVALAWERPLWLAVPLIAAISLFAEVSRFTWLFAPGLWGGMLELGGAAMQNNRLDKAAWLRAISVGFAGIFGGYAAPFYVSSVIQWIRTIAGQTVQAGGSMVSGGVTLASVGASVSSQPLLWNRLFPNATYGYGILIGLILAVAPLIVILIHLLRTQRWMLNGWQRLAIIVPLLAFLVVGLIVSVKIGGGGDLHNLDMFIIGLMFAGALAWRNDGDVWIETISAMPVWIRFMVVGLIVIPGYKPLMFMTPTSITADVRMVATLADTAPAQPLPDPLPDTLPSESDSMKALDDIRQAVKRAAPRGEILFMDQRQLLTFGFIKGIALVPEYDKKVLIDRALAGNAVYFEDFYRDLASHRFSLIITQPVNRRLDQTEGHFSEENNAWVKWVARPLLCHYQSIDTLKKIDVELLAPRQDESGCAQILP